MEKKIVNNYGSFDIVFVKGKNATLWASDGKKYIDFMSGIGVNSLGHSDKALVKAISRQAKRELHISNYYLSDVGNRFSSMLLDATGFDGGYFGNSGAEANEAAIKLARKYGYITGGKKRRTIVTLESSFHGRTLASLTATGQDKFHPECFSPYPEGFKTIRANDFSSFENAFDDTTAAFFIECVQGEGGVNILDSEWVQAVSEAAHKKGALVMVDEVQTGMGRTGGLLASSHFGIEADVVTLAKGIAGGVPMGACLFRGRANGVFVAGDHQSTFGGNPLAASAGIAVLERLLSKGFLKSVKEKGERIRDCVRSWKIPFVKDVRGLGLMIGIQLERQVKPFDVEVRCLEKGLCVVTAGADVVRFLPPLTISNGEIEKGLGIFKSVLLSF